MGRVKEEKERKEREEERKAVTSHRTPKVCTRARGRNGDRRTNMSQTQETSAGD